jgi:hypothetical protein
MTKHITIVVKDTCSLCQRPLAEAEVKYALRLWRNDDAIDLEDAEAVLERQREMAIDEDDVAATTVYCSVGCLAKIVDSLQQP